ncbi:hypothetical protein [Pseudomonas aegrilactucae]|uniref:Follicular epithelium yolk protein subunit n=1 Tax=Pseudomonas aegrilactucae TaxID=2854028 RepID=A0A9Q2XJR6_9PSED|nr:hypothetical protein [Pseudomonas aegrilactucae]MBV6288188.1 hypothetical protein [Pseudomonas aegrilactucae]
MAISISITAGPSEGASTVTASGEVQHIITDPERNTFNIQDASLKRAVAAYMGKSPNDAYVRSPTPWGDLYKTYNWPEVQSRFSVRSADVIGDNTVPVMLNTNTFKNNSSVPAEFNCGITQNVSVTSESNWSDTSSVEVGQSIDYSIGFLGTGISGSTSLNYTQAWQKGGSQSETVELGSSAGVNTTLQPGQAVKATLSASKGKLKVKVVYQITLSGDAAVNYNPTYKGHHFYGMNINSVMNAGGLQTVITTTETVEIEYYTDVQIVLEDLQSGKTLETFKLDVKRAVAA